MRSELRVDPITGATVLISPARARRPLVLRSELPGDQEAVEKSDSLASDPFLEGREDETEPETLAVRKPGSIPNGPGWLVRCISNRYPAVYGTENSTAEETESACEGKNPLHDAAIQPLPGVGLHEVVVECPQYETHLSRLPALQIGHVVRLWRDRLASFQKQEAGWSYGLVFKNQGRLAGASLPHSHSQIMALPFVPQPFAAEIAKCGDELLATGRSLWADHIAREQQVGLRIVAETPHFLAMAPYASRFPFELRILPKLAQAHFSSLTDEMCDELGRHLKDLLLALEAMAGDPDYNLVLQTAPLRDTDDGSFRWRLELLPRMGGIAGFEWGTGAFINTIPPEEAAMMYRSQLQQLVSQQASADCP